MIGNEGRQISTRLSKRDVSRPQVSTAATCVRAQRAGPQRSEDLTLSRCAGPVARTGVDVARLAAAVAHEEDHITALELAEWIRGRKPGLRIIDLRSAREFDTYHLPNAEKLAIESVVSTPFRPAAFRSGAVGCR